MNKWNLYMYSLTANVSIRQCDIANPLRNGCRMCLHLCVLRVYLLVSWSTMHVTASNSEAAPRTMHVDPMASPAFLSARSRGATAHLNRDAIPATFHNMKCRTFIMKSVRSLCGQSHCSIVILGKILIETWKNYTNYRSTMM